MPTALQRLEQALREHGSKHSRNGNWQCPAHEDANPSLHVEGKDGCVLLCCHAGCSTNAIVAALGLEMRDLFDRDEAPVQSRGKPDRSWEVRDHEGKLIAIHHRKDEPGRKKRIWWTAPDGSIGLGKRKAADLPLYGIDRLEPREPGDDRSVILCEGEPATDALLALGLEAVGTVTGASGVPSAESLSRLANHNVVLWPDDDEPGRSHMARIAVMLEPVCSSLRVFSPSTGGKGHDAADWLASRSELADPAANLLDTIQREARRVKPQRPEFSSLIDDIGYRLTLPALATTFEATQLRRERHQLRAEIMVKTTLPGAATFGGTLSVSDLNLSSARSRSDYAKHLASQAQTEEDLWRNAVEELAQRILAAERAGEADTDLSRVDIKPEVTNVIDVLGFRFPSRHPTVLFGDGDSAKSYLALYVLGHLCQDGLRVGLADWELSETDHRERLGRLFPEELPPVRYLRCARPITQEAQRLHRWVRDRKLDFLVCDSVAYACAGAPESAEVAMAYFQVVRQLGEIGSIHIAHITKAQEGSDRRPFGSAFWHNSPRATWYAKLADRDPEGKISRLGLFPRKWNIGPLPSATGFDLIFGAESTTILRSEVTSVPDLASTLSIKQRMIAALRTGGMTSKELAEEIEATEDSIRRTARRYQDAFSNQAGIISLLERRK